MVREPEETQRWMPAERSWGEFLEPAMLEGVGPLAGQRARANLYIETFDCVDSEPILRYDIAPGGNRPRGRARAGPGCWAPTSATAARPTAMPPATSWFWRCWRTVTSRPERVGELLLCKRVSDGKEAWLFTNPKEQAVTAKVDVTGWPHVSDLLGDAVEAAADGAVHLAVPALDVRVLIVEK